MPTATVNGTEIYYESHGEGEPLLCVMGLAADTMSWALQVPAFSERHRAVFFDNRDVGQSGYVTRDYTVRDMAHDAIGLADELGLDTFHLLGVSMGGMIAQEVALAVPERIRTLTLVVTFGGAGRWGVEKGRIWTKDAEHKTREDMIDELLLLCLSEKTFENVEMCAFLKDMMMQNPHPQQPEGFARQLAAASGHETRDRLGKLAMPVHVIGAEEDVLVPVWKSRELARIISGAELTVLEGAAHGVNLERAEEFNAAVLEFLAEHAEAGAPA